MASYETIPAAAAEDGLLATPKPQPSLKRLVAGAAVVSFALGAVAATAASTKIQTATSFIGKDGKVGCYLHFYCLDWNTDDLGSDC